MVLYGLTSILANIVLWYMVYRCWNWKREKESDTRFFLLVTVLGVIVSGAFYLYSLSVRSTIYYQDFACYYQLQSGQLKSFENGFWAGIKNVISSVWNDDYNSFMCIFGGIWYMLIPDKSVEAYIFEVFLWAIVPLAFLMAAFIKKILMRMDVGNIRAGFVVAFTGTFFMPLLHSAILQGMPDLFGLVFAFIILNIFFEYDMKQIEWDRNILLVIASVALFITRRWYAFWIVSFYICFFVVKVIQGKITEKSWFVYLKSILALGIMGGTVAMVCLLPLFRKILSNDYAQNYSAYYKGGFPWEIGNQVYYLGILLALLMAVGAIGGIIKKTTRYITIVMATTGLMSMFLFTRVQNAGFHQSLLFYTSYMTMLTITVGLVIASKKSIVRKLGLTLIAIITVFNWGTAVVEADTGGLMTELSLKPPVRQNVIEIQQVNQYIKEELITDEDTIVYIIPHSTQYNPTVFSNAFYPGELGEHIPYGAAVPGVHKFPVEFLEADYIMTSTPLEDGYPDEETIVKNLNKCLTVLMQEQKVEEIKRFSFTNEIDFVIYEKKEEIRAEDIDCFAEIFTNMSNQYPGMFLEILEDYRGKINNGDE